MLRILLRNPDPQGAVPGGPAPEAPVPAEEPEAAAVPAVPPLRQLPLLYLYPLLQLRCRILMVLCQGFVPR